MEYYNLLGLVQEPFSTTPDPDFFYRSREHKECLYRLEIALRLQRGLSVILGNVGTGKTTLCRTFIKILQESNDEFLFRLILDPTFGSEFQFLTSLIELFDIDETPRSTLECRNILQNFLYQKVVVEKKTPVLIIDEGQKLTPSYIEALRVLLNYETNKQKMLQLVIFAQHEFLHRLRKQNNFYDRINMGYVINPLNETDTLNLIQFRLEKAGMDNGRILFPEETVHEIYDFTQGYPRRIITLCHDSLIEMLRQEKEQVDQPLISRLIEDRKQWSI